MAGLDTDIGRPAAEPDSPSRATPPRETPERATTERGTLRACCGVHIVHDGLVDMLYAVLPILAAYFGLSYAQVGMIRAANKTATAALQIPAGILAERAGERGLLALGTALAGIAFIALGLSDGFPALLLLFFLAGCGAAVQHPLCSSLITAAFPGEGRRAALGTYNTFGDIGKFGFMGATILLTGIGLSWRVPMVAYGCIALLTALAAWAGLRALGIGGDPRRVAAATDAVPHAAGGWGIKSPAGFLALGGIAALDSITRNGFLTFVAFLMIEKGVATRWAALSVLLALFGGMCGKYVCGILAERIGVVRTIAATEIATAAGILAVVALPGTAGFLLLPFLGVVLNGTSSAIYGTVGELIEDGRHSRAYGLIYTLGSVCGIVAPLTYGLIADALGIETALTAAAAVVLLTLPLCALLSPRLRAAKAA